MAMSASICRKDNCQAYEAAVCKRQFPSFSNGDWKHCFHPGRKRTQASNGVDSNREMPLGILSKFEGPTGASTRAPSDLSDLWVAVSLFFGRGVSSFVLTILSSSKFPFQDQQISEGVWISTGLGWRGTTDHPSNPVVLVRPLTESTNRKEMDPTLVQPEATGGLQLQVYKKWSATPAANYRQFYSTL